MRWQSAVAPRAVCCRVTSSSKSTHGTTKSGPTLPLIRPMSGVRTTASCGDPPPDRPVAFSSVRIARTPDQLVVVGPPGNAQAAITARAPDIEPDCRAVWSMAASCAIAPSGVYGRPVGTPAGPVTVVGGSRIGGPGSRSETGAGWEADSGTAGIDLAASASWASAVARGPVPTAADAGPAVVPIEPPALLASAPS